MRHCRILVVFIFVSFFFGNDLVAETQKEAARLGAIVVTAKKADDEYETGDVDTEQTPANYTIIKREQFEGKMEDLAEVIKKEAGVQIRRSGGLGSFSTVSLRGSTSDQVMIYMDGILMNDASGGGVDLSNISLSDVESIEIYKGTTPINFGKASIGGVVNIKTIRSENGLNAGVGAGHGSFNTNDLSGFINYKPGKWDCLISADYLTSDNDYEIENDNGTPLNPHDDKKEKRNNAQFDQYNVLGKFGYDFNRNNRIDLVNQWFSKDQGLPNWSNTSRATLDTKRNISTVKFTANDLGSFHFNTATKFSYLFKNEEYRDVHSDIGLGNQHSRYITTRYGGEFYAEWLTDMNTLILVMDAYHETYEPKDLLSGIDPNSSSRDMPGIGMQDSLVLFEDMLTITPAFRYTYYKDKLKSGVDPYGHLLDSVSQSKGYFNPQIGLKLQPLTWLTFKTNLDRYNRVPSFFELFGDRGFFIGNYDLKAETGVNFDAGFEVNKKIENKLLNNFSANVTYFQSNIDDLITRVYDARGIGKSVNISSASIKGIELWGKIDLFKYFKLIGNATIQDPVNHSKIQGFDGKKLPGQFQKTYMVRAETRYHNWKLFAEYIANKDMYYDTANLLKAENQSNINIGISWLFNQLLLSLEAKNITDERYEDYNGYPMPGASYFVKAKYDF
ncbi:MAG: TonB-dependent receptor [Deltaproteobacteria bacterium]|nr:TonB-dependent receptor [Deltaproteobacteria bacterium]